MAFLVDELPDNLPAIEILPAPRALQRYGLTLVGRSVLTVEYGDWPGGVAVVTEINPDPQAPDILFMVRHEVHGEIGVLEHEEVGILHEEDFGSFGPDIR